MNRSIVNKLIVCAFILCFFWCFGAVADDAVPTYLPDVHGILVESLTKTTPFQFDSGTASKCERKVIADTVHYTCAVSGAVAVIDDTNVKRTLSFDTVFIRFAYHPSVGFYNEYRFKGDWSETSGEFKLASTVYLTLWYSRNTPSNIQGGLTVTDYKVHYPAIAKPN